MAFDPLEQDDSRALIRHFEKPAFPVGPLLQEGLFVPLEGETITLMGGADVFQMQDCVDLDVAMASAFPGCHLSVLNLGWSADSVYRQQRPMFFYTEIGDTREGSIPDQRGKVEPGTFVLMFGKMESLDGVGRIDEFEAAYENLIEGLQTVSQRLMLVSPVPFSGIGPAGELVEERNEILQRYTDRIAMLAERRGLIFLNLGGFEDSMYGPGGLYLAESGQKKLASQVSKALGWKGEWVEGVDELVRKKNLLWSQYYRPTNWAFLFGDRQHVPSSRGHLDENQRWFVDELERLPGMIAEVEAEISRVVKGGGR